MAFKGRRRPGAPAPWRTPDSQPWRTRLLAFRNLAPFLRIAWETSPSLIVAATVLRFLHALVPLSMLWVSKLILDGIVVHTRHPGTSMAHLWKLVIIEVVLAVTGDILGRGANLSEALLGDRFAERMSLRLMQHAATLDLASLEDPDFYDKLERARRQTTGRLGLLRALFEVGQDVVTLVTLSAGLILYSPWLILLLIATMIPAFVGETYMSALVVAGLRRRTPQRRQLDYLRYLGASAQTAKEIKALGLGDHLAGRYHEISDDLIAENEKTARRRAIGGAALKLVSTCGYYGVYALFLVKMLAGGMTLGTFFFLVRCLGRSRGFIEHTLSALNDAGEHALYLDDLFDFLALEPRIRSRPAARRPSQPFQEGFEFDHVCFAYPGGEDLVLRDLSFRLAVGERVALVGENGAGKSTVVKLLLRLYDPSEGRILLDGIDLREYDLDLLRREVSVIFQDYVCYELSVRDNIGFGDLPLLDDEARIEAAARQSSASPFIERLMNGYAQVLGNRFRGGVDLSRGQWQRLALARAYMREAQLFVLDEPTAALDARAERQLFGQFASATRDRTTLLISHRFSTVRMADRILVLGDGSVQEEGTHDELLRRGGTYAQLFQIQASGYS
jgi:ATP-binding cassette subfamily B protein